MSYKKIEEFCEDEIVAMEKNYKQILGLLGEDPEREGLLKTPHRIAKAMQFITHGNRLDAKEILNSAKFHEEMSQMIIVKDIELYSMCEHHLLPFFGRCHIGYLVARALQGHNDAVVFDVVVTLECRLDVFNREVNSNRLGRF